MLGLSPTLWLAQSSLPISPRESNPPFGSGAQQRRASIVLDNTGAVSVAQGIPSSPRPWPLLDEAPGPKRVLRHVVDGLRP